MAMASWRRTFGNVRSFMGNATGGLRGGANLASWVVAGTLAYFLWVKPAQDLKKEQEVIPFSQSLSCAISQVFCEDLRNFIVLLCSDTQWELILVSIV